ncbi:magnesium/cobalt transporter CorA [Anaerolineales bacterium]
MSIESIHFGRITWVNVVHPSAEDIDELQAMYPYIHPLNLEDIGSRIERPKIDEDDDYLFLVMHFPVWDRLVSITRATEVDFILGRGYIVTIHEKTLKPLQNLFNQCRQDEATRQAVMGRGASYAFHVIVDMLVDYIIPMLRKVEAHIRKIEEDIFVDDAPQVIRRIVIVRRDIIALRRIVRQQVPILEELENTENPLIHEDQEQYFGDVADHLYKARDIIEENYELINVLADTMDMLANHRINEVMRILTVFSVIMLPLTLLSSIYGMNVNLPFADHPDSFILLCGSMIAILLVMLIYFRRRHWL